MVVNEDNVIEDLHAIKLVIFVIDLQHSTLYTTKKNIK